MILKKITILTILILAILLSSCASGSLLDHTQNALDKTQDSLNQVQKHTDNASDTLDAVSDVTSSDTHSLDKFDAANHLANKLGVDSASIPPAYLQVAKFKNCLDTEDMGGWQGYCLPEERNNDCPLKSWDKLKTMNLIACSVMDDGE